MGFPVLSVTAEQVRITDGFHFPFFGRSGGVMFSALDSGSSGSGSRPGQGNCALFLGKTLCSHSASLQPGV